MNAKEARQLASKIQEDLLQKDYNKVISEIQKEVAKGKFLVNIYDNLLNKTVKKLEEDGYTLRRYQSGLNEYSYEITW